MDSIYVKLDVLEERFKKKEPDIRSYVQEPERFDRLREEAAGLIGNFQDKGVKPVLFGELVGVKDIFHVNNFETRAGSKLPPEDLKGNEAKSVTQLKQAGALVIGKTVTTEFAYFGPGPTRNPHNLDHTPGGSSSGSAAAAAAGLCDISLGTQTIGSINRPAAYCGVFGFKPTYERISRAGVIPLAESFDHVGIFSDNLPKLELAASVLSRAWQKHTLENMARLGVPDGPYLDSASDEGIGHFNEIINLLDQDKFEIQVSGVFPDFDRIQERHQHILAFETARTHSKWYKKHRDKYHLKTRELIEKGQKVSEVTYNDALHEVEVYRLDVRSFMEENEIDAWITPAAPGAAPLWLEGTGDPVMNLPWTQAGLPSITLPTGENQMGLPLGSQLVGRWGQDERLFQITSEVIYQLGVG